MKLTSWVETEPELGKKMLEAIVDNFESISFTICLVQSYRVQMFSSSTNIVISKPYIYIFPSSSFIKYVIYLYTA